VRPRIAQLQAVERPQRGVQPHGCATPPAGSRISALLIANVIIVKGDRAVDTSAMPGVAASCQR
jgi:hypothetical protein